MPTRPSRRIPAFAESFITGVRKHYKVMTIRDLVMIQDSGFVDIAAFNRNEVKARAGDADMLMCSLSLKMSVGMLVGYSNGNLPDKEVYTPSVDHILHITDGGHRDRWIIKILKNEAVLNGQTLQQLEISNPAVANRIKNYRVVIHISTHDTGLDLIDYAKCEYDFLNTTGEDLVAGEILRASTDSNEVRIQNEVASVYSRRKSTATTKKRDADIALNTSIGCGLINPAHMSKKKQDLLAMNPTAEQTEVVMAKLTELRSIEAGVFEMYKDNKLAMKLLGRSFNLDKEGSLIAAIHYADTPEAYSQVKADYMELCTRALEGASLPLATGSNALAKKTYEKNATTIWNDVWKKVSVDTNSNRNYDGIRGGRYTSAWNKVQNFLNPSPPLSTVDIGEIETL